MKNLVWDLVVETGNIKYYMLYKKLIGDDVDDNKESRRNNINRNQL